MRQRETVTLSLTPEDKAALESLAAEFSCFWGDKPNVSALLKAIARREIQLNRPDVPKEVSDRAAFAAHLAQIQIASGELLKMIREKEQ